MLVGEMAKFVIEFLCFEPCDRGKYRNPLRNQIVAGEDKFHGEVRWGVKKVGEPQEGKRGGSPLLRQCVEPPF